MAGHAWRPDRRYGDPACRSGGLGAGGLSGDLGSALCLPFGRIPDLGAAVVGAAGLCHRTDLCLDPCRLSRLATDGHGVGGQPGRCWGAVVARFPAAFGLAGVADPFGHARRAVAGRGRRRAGRHNGRGTPVLRMALRIVGQSGWADRRRRLAHRSQHGRRNTRPRARIPQPPTVGDHGPCRTDGHLAPAHGGAESANVESARFADAKRTFDCKNHGGRN